MRKSTLIKKSILIIIISILMLGLFTGCTIFLIPTPGQTGTVHINIANEDWYYDIYLDSYSNYLGTTDVLSIMSLPVTTLFTQKMLMVGTPAKERNILIPVQIM